MPADLFPICSPEYCALLIITFLFGNFGLLPLTNYRIIKDLYVITQ